MMERNTVAVYIIVGSVVVLGVILSLLHFLN